MAIVEVIKNPFERQSDIRKICNSVCICEAIPDIDYDNAVIYVNGIRKDKNYKLDDKDVCVIRQFPSSTTTALIITGIYAVSMIAEIATVAVTGKNWVTHIQEGLRKWLLPENTSASNSGASQIETLPTLSGSKNQSALGKSVPLILGKTYFTPYVLGLPYTTLSGRDGEEQTYHCLYLIGYHNLKIEDVGIGTEILAKNDNNVENGYLDITSELFPYQYIDPTTGEVDEKKSYYTRLYLSQGDAENPLYPCKVVQENFNAEMKNVEGKSNYVYLFSARYPKKVEIEIALNGLIGYNDQGEEQDASAQITLEYSVDNGQTWINGGDNWVTGGSTNRGGYDTTNGYMEFKNKKTKTLRYVFRKTYDAGFVNSTLGDSKVIRYRLKRYNEQSLDTKIVDKIYVTAIRTWCYDAEKTSPYGSGHEAIDQIPMNERERALTARLGFSIKVSEDLTTRFDQINLIATSKARTFDGNGWSKTLSPTRNPASLALMVMTADYLDARYRHDLREGDTYMVSNKIDLQSFGEAFIHYAEERDFDGITDARYYCDGAVVNGIKKFDLVNDILRCARSFLVQNGKKYSIFIDKPIAVEMLTLNHNNLLSLTLTKNFEDLPDGQSVRYISAINDYQQDTIFVKPYSNDPEERKVKSTDVLETIEFPYIIDPYHAKAMSLYNMACKKLRPETLLAKVSSEGGLAEIGCRVSIQSPIICVGIGEGAEIVELITSGNTITGIKVDAKFTVTSTSEDYGVEINIVSNLGVASILKKKLARFAEVGEFDTLMFDTAESSGVIEEGSLVSFGLYQEETLSTICLGKRENGDGSYDLTLLPYNSDIYNADRYVIRDFDPKTTPPRTSGLPMDYGKIVIPISQADMASSIGEAVSNIEEGDTTPPVAPWSATAVARENVIEIKWLKSGTALKDSVSSYYVEITKADESVVTFQTTNTYFDYKFDRDDEGFPTSAQLANWSIRVKAENIYGISSAWTTVPLDRTSYLTWQPPAPINVSAEAHKDYIKLTWTCNTANVFGANLFTVKKNGVVIESGIGEYSYNYYFNRENNEYPEKSDFDTASWNFTITVSNQSGLSATSSNAVYDKTQYKTWRFSAPTVTATPMEDYIEIKWAMSGDFYGDLAFNVSVNGTSVVQGTKSKTFLYYFDRENDGYPEIEDIEDDWTFAVTAISEAHTELQNNYTLDDSLYATWEIATPVIAPKAYEKYIEIPLNADTASYGKKVFDIYVDNVIVATNVSADSYLYSINPMLTSAVQALSIKVREKSVAGYADSVAVNPDVSDYKGYTPTTPTVSITSSGRSITLRWNDQSELYGSQGVLIQVAKAYKIVDNVYTPISDPSELVWYAPALGLNPYESLDNYKQGNEGEKLNVATGTTVSFSVPLYGQPNGSRNTLYAYRVKAKTTLAESSWSSITYIEARATSASDVVKAWELNNQGQKVRLDGALGVQQIFVEELSALCANLGYITDGALQGDQYNYWAVNDTVINNVLYRKGSFRVGGEHQYIQVTPKVEGGVATGEYDIDFVINDFSVSATGDVSVNGNTFTVYDEDENIIFQTSSSLGNSIMVEEGTYVSGNVKTVRTEHSSYSDFFMFTDEPNNSYWFELRERKVKEDVNGTETTVTYLDLVVYKNEEQDAILSISGGSGGFDIDPSRVKVNNFVGTTLNKVVLFADGVTMFVYDNTNKTITQQTISASGFEGGVLCAQKGDYVFLGTAIYNLNNQSLVPIDSTKYIGKEDYCFAKSRDQAFYLTVSTILDGGTFVYKIDYSGNIQVALLDCAFSSGGSSAYNFIRAETNQDGDIYIYGVFSCLEDSGTDFTVYRGCYLLKHDEINWENDPNQISSFSKGYVYELKNTDTLFNEMFFKSDPELKDLTIPFGLLGVKCGYSETSVIFFYMQFTTFNSDSGKGNVNEYICTIDDFIDKTTPIEKTYYTLKGELQVKSKFLWTETTEQLYIPLYYTRTFQVLEKVYFTKFSTLGEDTTQNAIYKYFLNPHDTITGHNTYATGIGFTQILYDENSGCYKYVLDSGASLEFNEEGELIVNASRGAQGEKGDKGDTGDTGVTPQITVVEGEHFNDVGTATVTQSGTPEHPILTFNYMKGASGAGSETAERLDVPRNLKVNLASSNAQSFDGSANAENIGVNGVLPIANGGTGSSTAQGAINGLVDGCSEENTTPQDTDFILAQTSGGGTTTKTYHRKPLSAIWNWILSKLVTITTSSATQGSTDLITSGGVYDELAQIPKGINKVEITTSQTITTTDDIRLLVNTSSLTITLGFDGNTKGIVVQVFAFVATTITYYTAQNTTATLSMSAGTNATFVYFNGWKYNGIYGAVWN